MKFISPIVVSLDDIPGHNRLHLFVLKTQGTKTSCFSQQIFHYLYPELCYGKNQLPAAFYEDVNLYCVLAPPVHTIYMVSSPNSTYICKAVFGGQNRPRRPATRGRRRLHWPKRLRSPESQSLKGQRSRDSTGRKGEGGGFLTECLRTGEALFSDWKLVQLILSLFIHSTFTNWQIGSW